MAKAAFNKKNVHLQIWLKFKEETTKVIYLEHSFVWCWNLDTSASRSEKLEIFYIWCCRSMEKKSLTIHVKNEVYIESRRNGMSYIQ
jgi:hypothetical protein